MINILHPSSETKILLMINESEKNMEFTEAVVQKCSVKKAWPATLLKKRLWHRCFPVNFVKFLRTPIYRTPLVAASEFIEFYRQS